MLTNGHIVPESVLTSLCCWRARLHVKVVKETLERRYMFRTDIKGGCCVSAKECTTKFNKLLCEDCEERLEHIDRNASEFWEKIVENWSTPNAEVWSTPSAEVEVALASIMARAMCISQHFNQTELCTKLITATNLKFKPKKSTQSRDNLNEIGFLCYGLPLHQGYRVEFPFFCDVKVGQKRIRTVCAQVPPFFCLLPYDGRKAARVLEHYLHIITKAIHTKLDKILYMQATKKSSDCEGMMSNFSEWYKTFHANGPGPLLVFDYLDGEILEVNIQDA